MEKQSKAKISATIEFNKNGWVKNIFLNAQSSGDEDILEKGIERLVKPSHTNWLKKLFQK